MAGYQEIYTTLIFSFAFLDLVRFYQIKDNLLSLLTFMSFSVNLGCLIEFIEVVDSSFLKHSDSTIVFCDGFDLIVTSSDTSFFLE